MKRLIIALLLASALLPAVSPVLAGNADPFESWGHRYPITGVTHFAQMFANSAKVRLECGRSTGPERKTKTGWEQRFQRCRMVEGPVRVEAHRSAHKTPTSVALPTPTTHPTPRPVPPTSTPIGLPFVPGPVGPTATPTPVASSGIARLLSEINSERASHGYAPLTLDPAMSNGSGSCMGAVGHAQSMAQRGDIGHWDFPADICGSYQTAGENVGVAAYGSENADIDQVQTGMLSEPWSPGCQGNHHCNEDSPSFTRIGLAVVPGTYAGMPAHYLSEEFAGP